MSFYREGLLGQSRALLRRVHMMVEMPSKFKRNKRNLKYFASDTTEQLFRNNLASRATGLGDQAATSEINLAPFGVELVPLALLPQTRLQ